MPCLGGRKRRSLGAWRIEEALAISQKRILPRFQRWLSYSRVGIAQGHTISFFQIVLYWTDFFISIDVRYTPALK
jgi:hypothetical protein